MEKNDIIIIGGGIVGLASALKILEKKPKTSITILEKESSIAQHQTGNNSGVIHSGLYYKPGSLKAKNCATGRDLMYKFLKKHKIPHDKCGKIVVALSKDEIPALKKLKKRGVANGLKGLKDLNAKTIKKHESNISGVAGLFVPQTGIVDYKKVCKKYAEIITKKGGTILLNTTFKKLKRNNNELTVITNKKTLICKNIINCAGLFSDRVAKNCGINPKLKIMPFRGEYYKLQKNKRHLINNLIYPVPDPRFPFLGVHFTRMIDSKVEAGPNAVLAFKREGYKKNGFSLLDFFDIILYRGFWIMAFKYWKMALGEYHRSFSKKAFTKALKKLLPALKKSDLLPANAGIRAQALAPNGKLLDDFCIVSKNGILNILNSPSPAATASLSVGEAIAKVAIKDFKLK